MKRFVVILGVLLLLLGVRLSDSGIFSFSEGKLTDFSFRSKQTTNTIGNDSSLPFSIQNYFLPSGADSYRIDLIGQDKKDMILEKSNAVVMLCEKVDGIEIIYCFSPLINRTEWLHGKRVNMMLAVSGESVTVGVPFIIGSF